MLVVDNSESSRNGDYTPSRFDAQVDAINIIFDSVTQGNPESSVGLMSMGGKGPEVLSTLTTERGKLLEGLHRTKKKISGSSHLATGIQIASVCDASCSVFSIWWWSANSSVSWFSLPSSTDRTSRNANASLCLYARLWPMIRRNSLVWPRR